jgi:hypothetical protein
MPCNVAETTLVLSARGEKQVPSAREKITVTAAANIDGGLLLARQRKTRFGIPDNVEDLAEICELSCQHLHSESDLRYRRDMQRLYLGPWRFL